VNDHEQWKKELRREDAEFFSELVENKESVEFFVERLEAYDECNVLLLVGFKDEVPAEFRRELRRLGGVEFGGTIRGQIAAIAEDDPEPGRKGS
jgi:hypothetical protein